jgi:hypothetical protein
MSAKYDGRAACPFFLKAEALTIECEGLATGACNNWFGSKEALTKYATKKCCEDYKSCKHYRALMLVKYNIEESYK